MKRIGCSVAFLFILLNFTNAFSENPEYSKKELRSKKDGYTRMQTGGIVLLIGGIALDCIGPFLLIAGVQEMSDFYESTSDEESSGTSDDLDDLPDGFGKTAAGISCLGFGIPLTIGGCVVKAIARRKVKEYQSRMNDFSFDISPNKISITCSF